MNDYVSVCVLCVWGGCVCMCVTWLVNNQKSSIGEEFLMDCYWKYKAQILCSWPTLRCYWPLSVLAGERSTLAGDSFSKQQEPVCCWHLILLTSRNNAIMMESFQKKTERSCLTCFFFKLPPSLALGKATRQSLAWAQKLTQALLSF